jgi:hypothetical protein
MTGMSKETSAKMNDFIRGQRPQPDEQTADKPKPTPTAHAGEGTAEKLRGQTANEKMNSILRGE